MDEYISLLLKKAAENGIEPAEVYMAGRDSFRAMCQNQMIGNYTVSTTKGLCLRGIYNGRMGYASTESFDDGSIAWLIERVKESAELNEEAEQPEIYQGDEAYPELDYYSPDLDKVSAEEKLDFVRKAEKCLLARDPKIVAANYDMISVVSVETKIENSYGLKLSHRDNNAFAYLSALAKEQDKASTGSKFQTGRSFAEFNAEKLAEGAAEQALFMLKAQPVKSGTYRCIFDKYAMSDMLGVFSSVFSAENAQKSMSLLAGKEGQKIASDTVTLMDDPLLENGFDSCRFDDEGVACKTKKVIDKGVLTTLLHNLKTARKAGCASTGNGRKASYSSPVRVAPTNFFFAPGDKSLQDMMTEMGDGIVITEVSGLHAGANPISGDFSLIAEGYVVHEGLKADPVEQVTVAGNFFALLNNIRCIGSDLVFPGGGIGSPSVDVGMVTIAGK